MPLSPEQLGLTRQVDVDTQGGAVKIITKKSAPTGPVTEHKDSNVRFEEGILALRYFAHRVGREINQVLDHEGIGPTFEGGEVLFGPYSDNPTLRPDKVAALIPQADRAPQVTHISPWLLQETLDQYRNSGQEVEPVKTVFDMGDAGKFLTLPVDFGPREPEGRGVQGLFSMAMERRDHPMDPMVIVGKREELQEKLSDSGKSLKWQPIRLGTELRNTINERIKLAARTFGNRRVEIPAEFEGSGGLTAVNGEVNFQNGRFFVAVGLDLEDGRRVAYLLNPQQSFNYESEGRQISEETEGSVFTVLTADSRGEPLIASVLQRRLHGNTGKIEIPRGFPTNLWRELREELGLGPDFVANYRRSSVKLAEDPIRTNTTPDFNLLVLPGDKKYHLEAQNDRDASEIEVISPDWMRLDEFIEGAVSGEYVNDAHSIAAVMQMLIQADALRLNDEAGNQAMVMERIQDWRTGGSRLTIPRGDSKQIDALKGDLNPNSGMTRIWNEIGYGSDPSVLRAGSYEVVQLADVFDAIKNNQLDIVTMSSMFRLFLQKGLATIDSEALRNILS